MFKYETQADSIEALKARMTQDLLDMGVTLAAPVAPTEAPRATPAPIPTGRKPGRPRKNIEQPPSGAGTAGNPEPQAQVGNSASSAPDHSTGTTEPSAEPSPQPKADSGPAEAAAPETKPVTFDDMKASLQAVAGHEKLGMARATEILQAFMDPATKAPYLKVKAVVPEHFGPIVAKCNEALAAA